MSFAAILVLALQASGNFRSIGETQKTLSVGPEIRWVAVENQLGAVQLLPGPAGSVEARIRVEVSEEIAAQAGAASFEREVAVLVEGGGLRLKSTHFEGAASARWKLHWELRVPPGLRASVENAVGPVTIRDPAGEASVQLGVGDIQLSGASIGARCHLRTGTGGIQIRANQIAATLSAGTGSGEILFEIREGLRKPVDLSAGSGRLRLLLPQGYDGALDLQTRSGRIQSGFSSLSAKPLGPGGASLQGKLGGGEGRLQGRTDSGDIEIKLGGHNT